MTGAGMQRTQKTKNLIISIAALFAIACTVLFEVLPIRYASDETVDRFLKNSVPLLFGIVAVALLLVKNGSKIWGKPQKLWCMLPCLIIAVDNFQFPAYFAGKMSLAHTDAVHYFLFAVDCICVGLFEEGVFRGILFALLANAFSKDKKGFLKTYIFSSMIFGATHLLNVLAGAGMPATLLQVVYTTLTGGLFAFAFIKTKNIFFAAITHAVYNFCGLLFSESGLGTGAVLDMPTVIIMTVVCVPIGAFVLYKVWTYPEAERIELYSRLGFGVQPLEKQN
jgi:membrane protease YdiL (CAAX protease family)